MKIFSKSQFHFSPFFLFRTHFSVCVDHPLFPVVINVFFVFVMLSFLDDLAQWIGTVNLKEESVISNVAVAEQAQEEVHQKNSL